MTLRSTIGAAAAAAFLLAGAAPARAQEVQLRFADGRVSLKASNASVSRILQQWAQIGGTTIVNGERIPGAPVTLELNNVPEREALDILLRGVSGYIAAQGTSGAGASRLGRILILPTSVAPAVARAAQARPAAGRANDDAAGVSDEAALASADSGDTSATDVPVPRGIPLPSFGTWRDPDDAVRTAAAATFGAATAARPGQSTAVVPPPRPAGEAPTPQVQNQTFTTSAAGEQAAAQYQMRLRQIQQQELQRQQQQAPATEPR